MAITRGFRFQVPNFREVFPKDLILMGEIEPLIKYNPDRNAMPEQRRDFDPKTGTGTGLLMWKANVTDPTELKANRASFALWFIAEVVPIPQAEESLPGMRRLVVEGLMAEPKIAGQGDFKYQSYQFYATGIAGDNSGAKGNRPVADKAA
ncbi:hypothetical protein [Nocardia sp. NPDC058666]|uniref:hypothetical protein n=1 Tax=Nocardia sp. NPDC058666 TaxID=3346587 RepID=UPI00364C1E6E